MTGKEVPKQQVLVVTVFIAEPQRWHQSRAIEHKTGVPGSTVRQLLLTLSRLGILDRSEMFGGYRYRLSSTARARPYFGRLQEASAVMQT